MDVPQFVDTLMNGAAAAATLLPSQPGEVMTGEPNASACRAQGSLPLLSASSQTLQWRHSSPAPGSLLMGEIWLHGPVVGVLMLAPDDFERLAAWNGSGIFAPASLAPRTERHCLTVYGWGASFWLVQNSFGPHWGLQGRAMLARGLLEAEWYAFTANSSGPPLPGNSSSTGAASGSAVPALQIAMLTLLCTAALLVVFYCVYTRAGCDPTRQPPPTAVTTAAETESLAYEQWLMRSRRPTILRYC